MKFTVDITTDDPDKEATITRADDLHNWLCSEGDGPCPSWIFSFDGVDPVVER